MKNIRKTSDPISVGGVGGVLEVDLVGDLPGFGEVYYNPNQNAYCATMIWQKVRHPSRHPDYHD